MEKSNMRYFLYARKSTDEPDRQILSIEAQLAELRDYAKKNGLTIAREFIESKTAKEPGRAIFNEMVAGLEQGAAHGIVAWHPDRLARNSIDGGKLVYLVDTGKVLELKFPTFWFDPTPQGKFMLSIAFGQSKYYVDNLSENVKRGIRQKLRNGIWPSWAPMGYLNNLSNHTIHVDKERAPIIKKAFELYATGNYAILEIRDMVNRSGLRGRKLHKPLSVSNCHYMLRNPIYYGVMRYYGEVYEAKHKSIISKALFDKCQEMLKNKSKPKTKTLKPYVYRGAFRCANCGCFITTETQKGRNYLHCTKRKVPCAEPYVREDEVEKQIRDLLKGVSLPPALAADALHNINKEELSAAQAGEEAAQNLRDKIDILTKNMNALLDMILSGMITQDEYAQKKRSCIEEKKENEMKLAAFEREGSKRFEPLIGFYKTAVLAGEAAAAGNPEENLQILKKIGSNFLLGGKKIKLKFNLPAEKLRELAGLADLNCAKFSEKKIWRPLRDSNP